MHFIASPALHLFIHHHTKLACAQKRNFNLNLEAGCSSTSILIQLNIPQALRKKITILQAIHMLLPTQAALLIIDCLHFRSSSKKIGGFRDPEREFELKFHSAIIARNHWRLNARLEMVQQVIDFICLASISKSSL